MGRGEDLLTIVALILSLLYKLTGESEHYKCSQEYRKKAFEQVVTTDEEKQLVSRLLHEYEEMA